MQVDCPTRCLQTSLFLEIETANEFDNHCSVLLFAPDCKSEHHADPDVLNDDPRRSPHLTISKGLCIMETY